jgi:hypothetical protein
MDDKNPIRIVALGLGVLALTHASGAPSRTQLGEALAGMTVPFVANGGLTDPAVAFTAQTRIGSVFVTRTGELVDALPAPPIT